MKKILVLVTVLLLIFIFSNLNNNGSVARTVNTCYDTLYPDELDGCYGPPKDCSCYTVSLTDDRN